MGEDYRKFNDLGGKATDLYGSFTLHCMPGDVPLSATIYAKSGLNKHIPLKTVAIGPDGRFTLYQEPFPIIAFPFNAFALRIEYRKRAPVFSDDAKNHISIEHFMACQDLRMELAARATKEWGYGAHFRC